MATSIIIIIIIIIISFHIIIIADVICVIYVLNNYCHVHVGIAPFLIQTSLLFVHYTLHYAESLL